MACRRKRITLEQTKNFLTRLKALPILSAPFATSQVFDLPTIANVYGLTNYDTAYLALAMRMGLPMATNDKELRKAAVRRPSEFTVYRNKIQCRSSCAWLMRIQALIFQNCAHNFINFRQYYQ